MSSVYVNQKLNVFNTNEVTRHNVYRYIIARKTHLLEYIMNDATVQHECVSAIDRLKNKTLKMTLKTLSHH